MDNQFLLLWIFTVLTYMFPAFVAAFRHHRHGVAITALTMLLGWTVIGWIIAVVWAFSSKRTQFDET